MPLRTELRNGDQVEILHGRPLASQPAWFRRNAPAGAGADPHFPKKRATRNPPQFGERLLSQALRPNLTWARSGHLAWDRFLRDRGVRNLEIHRHRPRQRPPVIVAAPPAERFLKPGGLTWSNLGPQARSRSGSERDYPVQLAKCCQPIPATPSSASSAKAGASEVHNASTVRRSASARRARPLLVDVEWEHADGRHFDVSIRPHRCAWRAGKGRQRHRQRTTPTSSRSAWTPSRSLFEPAVLLPGDRPDPSRAPAPRASGGSRKWYASCGPRAMAPLAERRTMIASFSSLRQPGRILSAVYRHVPNQRPPQIAQPGVAPQDDPWSPPPQARKHERSGRCRRRSVDPH